MVDAKFAEKSKPDSATMTVKTPVGDLTLVERDGALVAVHWGKARREQEPPTLAAAKAQLDVIAITSADPLEARTPAPFSTFTEKEVSDCPAVVVVGGTTEKPSLEAVVA